MFISNLVGTAEVLEQVFSESDGEKDSDDDSVFHPSDASVSSDDEDDDDNNDVDYAETTAKSNTIGEIM